MKAQRITPGKVQRQEWEQPWAERVPQELLILGKVYIEVIRMVLQDSGPSHDPSANWEELYQRPPSHKFEGPPSYAGPGSG